MLTKNRTFSNIIFLSCIFILLSQLSFGQQTHALSLRQAIDLSIKNSKQLKVSKARIDIATASLISANNNKLPSFNLSGSYIRLPQPSVNLAYKASPPPNGQPANAFPSISSAAYGIANIAYPIYAGGKIKFGIESAKYLQQAATLDAENDKDAITLNTINAYINIYKASLTVNILKNNLEVSRARDSNFSRLEQNGLIPRNDLLKTQLQTSSIELNLLEAQSNLELASINLNLMLGITGNAIPILDSAGFNSVDLQPLDFYQSSAFKNRKDYEAIEIRKKANLIAIKSANADAYPTIALTGGYVAAYIPKFITITNAINAGVGVQYNLASLYKSNSRLLEARARNEETIANQQSLVDAITYQVDQSYASYVLSQKKIEVYGKAIAQAAENYRVTKNRYDNSLSTLTELLDADVANQQAILNYTLAKADAIALYNKLLQTAGLLKY